jgi:hypothetical protein
MKHSRRANSVAVKGISCPWRRTSRVAGFKVRSPTLRTQGRSRPPSPGQRAHPGQQLGERERLDEIIVGAGIEAGHPVVDGVARRQEQDRRRHATPAQVAQQRQSIELGQQQVEKDDVVARGQRMVASRDAIAGDIDGVARFAQALPQRAGNAALVLDDQQPHAITSGDRGA